MRLTLRVGSRSVGAGLLCSACRSIISGRLLGPPSPWPRRFLGWVGASAGMRVRVRGHAPPLARPVRLQSSELARHHADRRRHRGRLRFEGRCRALAVDRLARPAQQHHLRRADRARSGARPGRRAADRAGKRPAGRPVSGRNDRGRRAGAALPRQPAFRRCVPPLPGVQLQPIAIDYGDGGAPTSPGSATKPPAANAKRVLSRPGTAPVTTDLPRSDRPGRACRTARRWPRLSRAANRRWPRPSALPPPAPPIAYRRPMNDPEDLSRQILRLPDERL